MRLKDIWGFLKEIFSEYSENKIPKLGASLAYYTIFSIAPLLIIVIAVAGFIFGKDAAQGQLYGQIKSMVGNEAAVLVQTAIKNSSSSSAGIIATVVGIITLIIGATAVFIEIQDSLNIIWRVKPKANKPLKEFLRTRFTSFALVISIGLLLMVSLVISAAISALTDIIDKYLHVPGYLFQLIDVVLSLSVIFVLFSMIFKMLPDVELSWKDVRIGALVTTILFVTGKYLIGLYLGRSSVSSVYGAASSLAIILVWIYYSSQILYLGAEFTYVYAVRYGSGVKPTAYADAVTIQKVSPIVEH
ncbi:MAG: YihY/virulence factor BrkB family protein [Clostridiales bacterium]